MLSLFQKKPPPPPRVPAGERVYAVGDVHGRLDLLDRIVAMIDADDAARGRADTRIVLLGDLIDRGPDASGVVERTRALVAGRPNLAVLMGNHEEILLGAARGDRSSLGLFNRVGGRETMLSYGVDGAAYDQAGLDELAVLIANAVPPEHLAFLASLGERVASGDYLFVHAGIRPRVALDAQAAHDLRWIREPFLSATQWHGAMIVHGHTITDAPDLRDNRIGIDTGAYATGRLTALGLEGAARWFLQT